MTLAPVLPRTPATGAPGAPALARRFLERQGPALEAALVRAATGLVPALAPVQAAASAAVGTEGRGGRRWRPMLALAAAEACGAPASAALGVAVAVELTHTASLVLDDLPVMDDAEVRRGRAATHKAVGQAGAILVAVGLLGRAAEALATAPVGAADLGGRWGRAIGFDGMAGGQAVDVALGGRARGAARRLHRQKTAALAALALGGGARAAGAEPVTVATLAAAGRDLGWAYQLVDDAADRAEDDAQGHVAGGRAPRRQAARLQARARRRLVGASGLTPEGGALLAALAAAIVPVEEVEWTV